MAELADALDSGSSGGDFVQVQVLLPAPTKRELRLSFFVGMSNRLRRICSTPKALVAGNVWRFAGANDGEVKLT